MTIKTIFFDIGNTLFFYNYDFLRGLLADRFGINVYASELEEAHRTARKAVIANGVAGKGQEEVWFETYRLWLTAAGIDEESVTPITRAIREHRFPHMFWARMDEGVIETLDWFRERGFKLGVISNAQGQIQRLLEHTGIDYRFDVVADSAVVGVAKPDKEIFKYAMQKIGANPENCVHVGDVYDIDVVGAMNAGMTPVLVDKDGVHDGQALLTIKRAKDLPGLPLFSM